jgi:hypothetical protein
MLQDRNRFAAWPGPIYRLFNLLPSAAPRIERIHISAHERCDDAEGFRPNTFGVYKGPRFWITFMSATFGDRDKTRATSS